MESSKKTKTPSLKKSAGVMSIAVFFSRILGLAREQVFAYFFGASAVSDAYLVAFRIPNLFRDLLAEGALSSSFVSVFAKIKDPQEQLQSYKTVVTALVFVLVVLSVGMWFGAPWIVSALVSEKYSNNLEWMTLTISLTRWMLPILMFTSLAALSMGLLNTKGKFFLPALAPGFFNVASVLVGGGMSYWFVQQGQGKEAAIFGFTMGTVMGGFLQWSIQWRSLWKLGFSPLPVQSFIGALKSPYVRQVIWLMAPAVLSLAAVQINVVINTQFATQLEEGSVTWLNFAYRILHFPMGVFGVALSTAALPRLAKLWGEKNQNDFVKTLDEGFRWSLVLAMASAAGFYAFSDVLVSMFYEHGAFDRADTIATAKSLQAYGVGLFAFNLAKMFGAAFFAMEKVWIPSAFSFLAILTNYILNSYLVGSIGQAWALALGTSLTSILNVVILGIILNRKSLFQISGESFKTLAMAFVLALGIVSLRSVGFSDWLLNLRSFHGTGYFVIISLLCIGIIGGAYMGILSLASAEFRKKFIKRK